MQSSIERGIATEGILPGGLNVRRRAPRLHQRIQELELSDKPRDPLAPLDWVSLFAIAVNEENAAGGRVVTAPTNGAAGVIPAIAQYYLQFIAQELSDDTGLPGSCASSSPPPRSASFTRRTPASPALKSAARARSASPAQWLQAVLSPRSPAPTTRWSTPPRSPWSTTWA